jgi:predicted GIY-YIG superfamily endonuclease
MNNDFVYITADLQNILRVDHAHEEKIINILKNNPDEKLLYYELYDSPGEAVERTKSLKQWPEGKIKFVVSLFNPEWKDYRNEIIQ